MLNKFLLKSHFPDFIIVGVQKGGTTTLHSLLNQHPQLQGSTVKELHYFDRKIHERDSLKNYKKNFLGNRFKQKKYFESTPNYMYQQNFGEEIVKLNPNIKLIILLREPVERAFSAWNMFRDMYVKNEGKELLKHYRGEEIYDLLFKSKDDFPSFEEAIEMERSIENSSDEPSFLRRGLYEKQINRLYESIKKDNILVLFSTDLKSKPHEELKKTIEFLGVEPFDFTIRNLHEREYVEKISEETKQKLKEYFKESNLKLSQLLGKKITWNDI